MPDIDAQHRKLFDLINRLHDAMLAGSAQEVTAGTLEELASYTRYHFDFEEKKMESARYAGLDDHRRVHRAMVEQVQKYIYESRRPGARITVQLMNFLKNWLSRHILETDMRYRGQLTA
jgi:hemerythrin-like metal-binding protein